MTIRSEADDLTLHVLHTNDFHNCLRPEGEAVLRAAIDGLNGAPYVLIDAGDAIKAGNIGVSPFGEPILERMSGLGYHAMTMGNREFHVWKSALQTKIADARFPILCANIRARQEATLPVEALVTVETGGLRVVIVGVTVPMVTARMTVAALSSFVFDDPVATAGELVAANRRRADIVIALTHIGLREDRRLAKTVSGIDLIVGGHTHAVLEAPEVIAGTPIVQCGAHAHFYGHVQLSVGAGGVLVKSAAIYPLQAARK
jgi:2',3'-cyclic-nucleotide 2'-phosphodiesterase (5'-nucleotidase family)